MRALWSGSISFGLINIPVKIYSASDDKGLDFRMLDKHGKCPISYARVCRATNEEIPYQDIVKGYEYQKGDFVILTDEDFKKAAPKKTKTIDIVSFVDEDEIPSAYIEKPYFIEPDKRAEKAYVLLREALKRSKKVGIAKWILRTQEHIAMVRPEGRALMLIQMRYEHEMRKPEDMQLPEKGEYSKRELEMALMLIDQLKEHFDAKEYKDTYTQELRKLIEKKAKGKTVRIKDEAEPKATDMRDLMDALKKSLEKHREKVPA
jgi:DNA end-binding protein Ku